MPTKKRCARCGDLFEYDYLGGRRRMYCIECRKPYPIATDLCCVGCGKPLGRSRPNRKWCSASCRSTFAYYSDLERNRERNRERARIHPKRREQMTTPCVVCGVEVTHRSLGRRYCSNRCGAKASYERRKSTPEFWAAHCEATRRRRARKKMASVVENFTSVEIFVRDGYRCHICRTKCARNVVVPHPLAPTIDHVIPLACGGDHSRANVATACFMCNSVKGDRGGGEQLAII